MASSAGRRNEVTTRRALRGLLGLIPMAVLALSQTACAAGGSSSPATIAWMDYQGAQDGEVQWAHLYRGFQRGNTGVDRGNDKPRQAKFNTLSANVHTVIIPIGALPSPDKPEKVQAYFRAVDADQGKSWGEMLKEQARNAASQWPGHTIYWQVGNEINSKMYSQNVAAIGGGRGSAGPNNSELIPIYAEKVLAPATVALREAGPGGAGGQKVLIATLANAFSRESQQWLLNFLDYQLRGTMVPSLKGRTVASLGDVVGIHYLLSHEGPEWRSDLDRLYSEVVVKRHMQGMWLTEEIGKKSSDRGLGAAVAVKVWARYMSWVSVNNLSSEQTKMNFWGWQLGDPGARGGDAMDYLYGQIGASPITVIGTQEFTPESFGELYAFKVKDTGGTLVVAVASRGGGGNDVAVPGAVAPKGQVTCQLFGTGGNKTVPCSFQNGKLQSEALGSMEQDGALVAVLK